MSDTRPVPLRLECRPSKAGNVLIFPYTLQNQGTVDVYAMHALPVADPESRQAKANETAGIVIAAEVTIISFPALDNISTCMCMWAGVISVTDPGQTEVQIP